MATKKKKTDSVVMDMPGTIGGAKLNFLEDSDKTIWPKIVVGSHSTRTEYEDGRVEFVSDWAALKRDVQAAIHAYESTVTTTGKKKSVSS